MKKILLTVTSLSLTGALFAQTHNEQVTVIAPYQPTVLDAYKINVNPKTIDSTLKPRDARFDILSRKVITSFGMDQIKPAKVVGEPLTALSPLYVRGGFMPNFSMTEGYGMTYGELFYGSERSAQWQYGAHLKHHAVLGTFENYAVRTDNTINSVNLIELFGAYYGQNAIVSADFYYDRKRYSTYGANTAFFLDTTFVTDKRYKRVYQNTGGNIRFSDNNTDPNRLSYSGALNIDVFKPHTADSLDENDVSFYFSGDVHQTFDFNYPDFTQTIVGLDVATDWHKSNIGDLMRSDMTVVHTGNFYKTIKFYPYGKFRFLEHDFSLGVRINTFDEFIVDPDTDVVTDLQLVPTLHAKVNLIENVFAVELGMDGNAEYWTQKNTMKLNPFAGLAQITALAHPQLHRDYYLGLNTALSKTLDFSVKGKIVLYKNLLNFDVDYAYSDTAPYIQIPTPFFRLTNDTVTCYQLQADLNYHLDEKISVSAMGRLNSYSKTIFYKPKYEANLTARYNMQDKIILKSQLYCSAGTKFRDPTFKRPIIDWNLAIEYRVNKQWAAFLEFNNLLNRTHYEWDYYRSYGLNFLMGATFNL